MMDVRSLDSGRRMGFSLTRDLNRLFNDNPKILEKLSLLGGEGEPTQDYAQQHAYALNYVSRLVANELSGDSQSMWSMVHPDVIEAMTARAWNHPQGRAFVRAAAQGAGVSVTHFVLGPGHPADPQRVEPVMKPLETAQQPLAEKVAPKENQQANLIFVEPALTPDHGEIVSRIHLRDGSGDVIRLYEDEHFEVISGGKILKPDQVFSSQMGWLNWLMATVAQETVWTVAGSAGRALGARLPGPTVPDGIKDVAEAAGRNALGQAVGDDHLFAPLTSAIPDVGSAERVVFVTRGDGSVWNLNFGWTPDKHLFFRNNGWIEYKGPERGGNSAGGRW